MIRNYFKIAFRNLWRHKTFSGINIFGLGVGFACCLLIGLYIQYELSYDSYHKNGDRIYRLATHVQGATYGDGIAKIGGPWASAAKQEIPEIEESTRFVKFGPALIKQGAEQLYENKGFFAEPSMFNIFSWKLLEGDAATALTEPYSVVLTESLAHKLFAGENAVGQNFTIDNEPVYKITGVIQDPPLNSHFDFSFLVSLSSYQNENLNDWKHYQFYTYLLLKPDASSEIIAEKLDNLIQRKLPAEEAKAYTPFLQLLTDIHLHSKLFREIKPNSDIKIIYILSAIAFLILVIASMNFINLTTAKAGNRAKEVGIRKATGAMKTSLIKQFVLESMLVGLLAGMVAYVLGFLLVTPFGDLMGSKLNYNFLKNSSPFLFLFGLIFLTCIISSIYPAFVLSSFKTIKVLKGNFSFNANSGLRKTLVVFQFALSIGLIFAVLIIQNQTNFMRQKDLGFNKEQIIVVPLNTNGNDIAIDHILDKIRAIPGVISISASSNQPGGSDWGIPYEAIGLPEDRQPAMRCLVVDENFLETYDIQLAEGRSFSKDFTTDSTAYLINETAARQLGWEDPVGQQLSMPAISRAPGPIIGVVKDFHYHSLHEVIEPLYIFMKKDWFSQLNIKIDAQRMEPTLASLKNVWTEIEPQYPLKYDFLDQSFEAFYEKEKNVLQMLVWFTVMAIIISSLGLYALSTLIAKQRVREIGIRKVLGASVTNIVSLLSKDFLKLILLAIIISLPVTWYIMEGWLEDFAYKVSIGWIAFVIAGLSAVFIAFITISFEAIKAAIANPVKSLRTE